MRIITLSCQDCGTIVSANELESDRVMKCPRTTCSEVLRFEDLPEDDREFFLENIDQYQI